MKKDPIEKGKWICDKIGALPYNLTENHKSKTIRKIGLLLCIIWTPVVLTPFAPYLIFNMIESLLYDA